MNFRNVNFLNIRLNQLSGNLLPMIDSESSFSSKWRWYGGFVWIIELALMFSLIPGSMNVSLENVLQDGLITFAIIFEVMFTILRIHACRNLVQQLIRHVDDILCNADENMRKIVTETLKPVKIPFKLYMVAGVMSIIWYNTVQLFQTMFERSHFWYEDFKLPVAFCIQPFSLRIFILGTLFVAISSIYLFLKKVSVDLYMIHLVLMITAQYRYTAEKIAMIFHEEEEEKERKNIKSVWDKDLSESNQKKKREILALCRHHNVIIQ